MRNVLASICLLALAAVAGAQGYTPGSALNYYRPVPLQQYYVPYYSAPTYRSLDGGGFQSNMGTFNGYVNGNYIHGSTQRVGTTTYIHGYNSGQWFNGRVNSNGNSYFYGQ